MSDMSRYRTQPLRNLTNLWKRAHCLLSPLHLSVACGQFLLYRLMMLIVELYEH